MKNKLLTLIAVAILSSTAFAASKSNIVEGTSLSLTGGKLTIMKKQIIEKGEVQYTENSHLAMNGKSIWKFDEMVQLGTADMTGGYKMGDLDIVLFCDTPGGNGYGDGCNITPLFFDKTGKLVSPKNLNDPKANNGIWCEMEGEPKITADSMKITCVERDGRRKKTTSHIFKKPN